MTATPENALSRRGALKAALAAGCGLALGRHAWAATLPPITKTIPSTGEKLPVVGIGTNQFSVSSPEEIAARRAVLEHLPQLGGKVVDTARAYGESEEVIGKLVKELGNRDRLFLATKTPMSGEIPAGEAVVAQALQRLQTARIDLLQVHNFHGIEELYPVLTAAKQAGTVRYIGMTTSTPSQHPQMIEALRRRRFDFIQVDYSIEDQAAEPVLQLALEQGVAVLINVPLGGRRGSLMSKVKDKPLPAWAADIDASSWAQLLLKYTIAHPAVTAVIPGTTKLAHLEDNELAGRGRLPDAAFRKKIEAYWATV